MKKREPIEIGKKYNHLTPLEKTTQKRGTSYLFKCMCDCDEHNITYATSADLKTGHKKSCGCIHTLQRQKLGQSKKQDLTGKFFGDLEVIEDSLERVDGRVMWKCFCHRCETFVKISSHDLLEENRQRTNCGCENIKSKGEEKIIEILKENNIPFEREYSFSDLISDKGKKLRFDFYVNNSYLIEYDGKQHFIYDSNGFGKDLDNIQKRDFQKNEYCLEKQIPLIRIPYTHLKDLKLEDLTLESRFMVERRL